MREATVQADSDSGPVEFTAVLPHRAAVKCLPGAPVCAAEEMKVITVCFGVSVMAQTGLDSGSDIVSIRW